ncbi:uncharacterized protein RAG0_05234 [Rhynchosporium agropyri]|uniref:Uncharacterized protein n=2 Tax=Rhynchosporium TaxID=38037 RepID=A0A1E1LW77_RHYSE|nr:uncharacterized protein RAG0_05234 [Rhynchosporium agropyri]CZT41118.1 uncharacterized protein RSE6_00810 [Rhynchosporium secalis]
MASEQPQARIFNFTCACGHTAMRGSLVTQEASDYHTIAQRYCTRNNFLRQEPSTPSL